MLCNITTTLRMGFADAALCTSLALTRAICASKKTKTTRIAAMMFFDIESGNHWL